MKPRSSGALGFLALICMLAASCASVNVNRSWTDPTARTGGYRSMMVFCSCPDTIAARILEDAVVRRLAARSIQAQPAYQVVNPEGLSESQLRESLQMRGIDAIVLAKMAGVENRTTYVPGTWYTVPETYYSSFYERFVTVYRQVHERGYLDHYQVLDMEADLYDERSGKLVTSLSTSQVKSGDVNADMDEFAKTLVTRLARSGGVAPVSS